MTRYVLSSIHDVTPVHAARLERLVPIIEAAVGPGRFALLVVPEFHRRERLRAGTPFAGWLRRLVDRGCEVFLHGFYHLDDQRHDRALDRWRARKMTAGEGEFLGLSQDEAQLRLTEGRKLVEDVIGQPVAGFIAPAWLYGDGAKRAIAAMNFALAEDHMRVWQPATGAILARGPVVTYASRSTPRLLSSLAWSRIATLMLARARIVRHAVHPHDMDSPALVKELDRALRAFARTHRPSAYRDLIAGPAPGV